MDDNARRALFKAWFDGPPMRGDRQKFMEKTGYSKGRLSQLLDSDQQFGERAARALANRLGLPEEAFTRIYSLDPPASVGKMLREEGRPYGEPPIESGMQVADESEVPQDDHQRRRLLTAFSKLLAADRARLLEQVEARAAEIDELEARLLRERPPAARAPEVVNFESSNNRRQRAGTPSDREQFLPGDPVRRTDAAGGGR